MLGNREKLIVKKQTIVRLLFAFIKCFLRENL